MIICGHITPHSMTTFLRDFLHKDRDQAEELDVVIVNKYASSFRNKNFSFFFFKSRKRPEIEMEALLKRYYTKVQYFVGSVMNIADLHRVQVYLKSLTIKKRKSFFLSFILRLIKLQHV